MIVWKQTGWLSLLTVSSSYSAGVLPLICLNSPGGQFLPTAPLNFRVRVPIFATECHHCRQYISFFFSFFFTRNVRLHFYITSDPSLFAFYFFKLTLPPVSIKKKKTLNLRVFARFFFFSFFIEVVFISWQSPHLRKNHLCSKALLFFFMLQDRVYCLKIAAGSPKGLIRTIKAKLMGKVSNCTPLNQGHILSMKVKVSCHATSHHSRRHDVYSMMQNTPTCHAEVCVCVCV